MANGINYLLDGGDNNDSFSNVNMPIPFPDAVQEFSVQTNAMQAQFGLHPGAVVNIVTKSGTNALHGDLFEYLRNYDLNARPKGLVEPNGSVQQPVRDSLKRNQYGGVIGGKIIRDKLFFFAGYQQTAQRSNPGNNTAHVPTALTAAGELLRGRRVQLRRGAASRKLSPTRPWEARISESRASTTRSRV